jgi:hypothetical protein
MNKPSWIERAKDLFGSSEDKEEKEIERTLHRLGLDILKDQKLEHRIKLLMKFEDLITSKVTTEPLNEYVEDLKDRQDLMNHAIYEISAPYARSGDFPEFGHMLHGWGRLNASAKSWILRTEDIVNKALEKEKKEKKPEPSEQTAEGKKEPQKTELAVPNEEVQKDGELEDLIGMLETETIDVKMLVHFLHDVLSKHIWKDGFLILGKCFLDRDVTPRAATVIQNINAQREREDMTKTPDF